MQSINIKKSNVDFGRLYFLTATINIGMGYCRKMHGRKLLSRKINISSLKMFIYLKKNRGVCFCDNAKSSSFYLATYQNEGKEKPHTSLLKFTAHSFKRYLQITNVQLLTSYAVDATNKQYEFWQKDSLPFELLNKETTNQKLDYIHNNPTAEYGN